jgi:hypothetical protein
MLTSNSAHLGSALGDATAEAGTSKELVIEWLKHPVTKVVLLVIVAELAHKAIIHYGMHALFHGETVAFDADA